MTLDISDWYYRFPIAPQCMSSRYYLAPLAPRYLLYFFCDDLVLLDQLEDCYYVFDYIQLIQEDGSSQ